MRALISIACLMTLAFGCAEAHQKAAAQPQKLYFAVELHQRGKLVGKPRLLGEDGKRLRAERRQPGAERADYVLLLEPVRQGGSLYRIDVDLEVPEVSAHSELSLLHGEVRKLELGRNPGDLAVTLTLMEVDSPEFRALMDLVANERAAPGAI